MIQPGIQLVQSMLAKVDQPKLTEEQRRHMQRWADENSRRLVGVRPGVMFDELSAEFRRAFPPEPPAPRAIQPDEWVGAA